MPIYQKVGKRGFSKTVEDQFGEYEDTVADYMGLNWIGEPLERMPKNRFVNSDEANGSYGPNLTRNITYGLAGTHQGYLCGPLAGIVCASMAQDVTMATVGAGRVHTCKFMSDTVWALRSRNMVERHSDGTCTQYSGVALHGFKVEAEKGPAKFIADVFGYNNTKVSALTLADLVAQTPGSDYLYGSQASFKRGTYNVDTFAFSSVQDYSAKCARMEFGIKLLLDEAQAYGFTEGSVGRHIVTGVEVTAGGRFQIDAIESAGDDWFTKLIDQSEFALELALSQGQTNAFKFWIAKARVAEAKLVIENGIYYRDVKFDTMFTPGKVFAHAEATTPSADATYIGAAS